MSEESRAKPVKVIDQQVEVFEIFSPQLGRNVRIGLKHNPDDESGANLMSDGGVVMMPMPPDSP